MRRKLIEKSPARLTNLTLTTNPDASAAAWNREEVHRRRFRARPRIILNFGDSLADEAVCSELLFRQKIPCYRRNKGNPQTSGNKGRPQ